MRPDNYMVDLYNFAESSYIFDLPVENDWKLTHPSDQIEYTVEVLKRWNERIGYKHETT